MSRFSISALALAAVLLGASNADATVVFSGSAIFDPPGTTLPSRGVSARAEFTISGPSGARQLTILLTNTDPATGAEAPDYYYEVLTGLFFNLGGGAFTPGTATLGPDGDIIQTSNCSNQATCESATNIGGEWKYGYGGASFLNGTNQGVSTGYLNVSGTNFTGGSNLESGFNGIEFGLVPNDFAAFSGDQIDNDALIEGTAKFVLNVPNSVTEAAISNVYFTFGDASVAQFKNFQATKEPGTGVPEPALLSLLGLALASVGYRMRRATKP